MVSKGQRKEKTTITICSAAHGKSTFSGQATRCLGQSVSIKWEPHGHRIITPPLWEGKSLAFSTHPKDSEAKLSLSIAVIMSSFVSLGANSLVAPNQRVSFWARVEFCYDGFTALWLTLWQMLFNVRKAAVRKRKGEEQDRWMWRWIQLLWLMKITHKQE